MYHANNTQLWYSIIFLICVTHLYKISVCLGLVFKSSRIKTTIKKTQKETHFVQFLFYFLSNLLEIYSNNVMHILTLEKAVAENQDIENTKKKQKN